MSSNGSSWSPAPSSPAGLLPGVVSTVLTPAMSMDLPQPNEQDLPRPSGSKKSIVTKHQSLGLFFGDPLTFLDPSRKPTKCEMIRLWISVYDRIRGDKFLVLLSSIAPLDLIL